jgi:nitroreductase
MNKLFKNRRSVRSFSDKSVEIDQIEKILEAANSAPSAGNLKARDILAVTEPEIKRLLADASFGQNQIIEAPVVFVFMALPEVSARKYNERGRNLYALQDATIAAGFAWLQAVDLGLSGGWIGGFDPAKVQKIIDLDKNQVPVAILPIGHEKK